MIEIAMFAKERTPRRFEIHDMRCLEEDINHMSGLCVGKLIADKTAFRATKQIIRNERLREGT